jgi:Cupredoxin-like domain
MTGPRALMLAAVAACAAAIAGCGHTQTVGGDRTVHIALSEYRLRPDHIRMSAGYVDIQVSNYGRLTHNLVITSRGVTDGSTKPIWPGQRAELTLSLAPGKYSISSTMLSDQALGAYGTLIVTG